MSGILYAIVQNSFVVGGAVVGCWLGLDVQQMFDQVRNDVMKATHSKQVPWTHATLTDGAMSL